MTFAHALTVVALMGFISLSYEILWYRAYSFVSGGTAAVFGLLLAAFLVGLAIGAFAGGILCRVRASTAQVSQLRTLGTFLAAANLVGFFVVPALALLSIHGHWAFSFPLVTLAASFFGATLPLVSHWGIQADELVGARLSYLYLANIIGSAAGSFLTGFVFMDVMPLRGIALLLALLGIALAALLFFAGPRPQRRPQLATVLLVITGAGLVLAAPRAYHRIYEKLLYKQRYSADRQFREVVETRSGVVTISPKGSVFGSGAYDGVISTSLIDDRNAVVRAYAVGALHPAPRRVLMIGLATGAWAHVLAQMPGVESFTVVEINPGYLQPISKYPEVSGLLRNSKVRIVIDDGRRWLARHPEEKFDVIVANTTWHWRAHITNLLSREYLMLIRRHLRPKGIYYFNTTSSKDAFLTAFSLFPYGVRFRNFAAVSDSPVRVNGEQWRQVLSAYTVNGAPVFDLSQHEGRAALERLVAVVNTLRTPTSDQNAFESRESVLARIQGARIITDDNMAPEWHRLFQDLWLPHDER